MKGFEISVFFHFLNIFQTLVVPKARLSQRVSLASVLQPLGSTPSRTKNCQCWLRVFGRKSNLNDSMNLPFHPSTAG